MKEIPNDLFYRQHLTLYSTGIQTEEVNAAVGEHKADALAVVFARVLVARVRHTKSCATRLSSNHRVIGSASLRTECTRMPDHLSRPLLLVNSKLLTVAVVSEVASEETTKALDVIAAVAVLVFTSAVAPDKPNVAPKAEGLPKLADVTPELDAPRVLAVALPVIETLTAGRLVALESNSRVVVLVASASKLLVRWTGLVAVMPPTVSLLDRFVKICEVEADPLELPKFCPVDSPGVETDSTFSVSYYFCIGTELLKRTLREYAC